MTPDDVRAAAEQLVNFHERFAPLFGKEQAQDHAYDYVKGLMVCPDRKSVEPIALLVGHGDVSGLQKFINGAPWQYDDVQAELQAVFDDELVPSTAGSRKTRAPTRASGGGDDLGTEALDAEASDEGEAGGPGLVDD